MRADTEAQAYRITGAVVVGVQRDRLALVRLAAQVRHPVFQVVVAAVMVEAPLERMLEPEWEELLAVVMAGTITQAREAAREPVVCQRL